MRKRTLAGVCSLLAFGLVFGLSFVGIRVPFGLSPFVVFLILVPLLMAPLAFLNKYLLTWRKTRGREIEEEEQYELGSSDFISLRPKSERRTDVTEENPYLPILFR